jgi:uncharacterized protein (TIGR02145 family)
LLILSNSCSNNTAANKEIFKDTSIQGFHGAVYNDTVWMKDFLNIDTFSNGDPIPTAKNAEEWRKACEGKKPIKSYADFDKNKHAIYNLYAVLDNRHIAPKGWQIPTEQDVDRILRVFQKWEHQKNKNVVKKSKKLPNYYLTDPKKWRNNWFPDDSLQFGYSSYLNLAPTKHLTDVVVSFSGATEFMFYPEKEFVKTSNNKTIHNEDSHFWWFNENSEKVGFFQLYCNSQRRELKKDDFSYGNNIVFMGMAIKCISRK